MLDEVLEHILRVQNMKNQLRVIPVIEFYDPLGGEFNGVHTVKQSFSSGAVGSQPSFGIRNQPGSRLQTPHTCIIIPYTYSSLLMEGIKAHTKRWDIEA